MSSFALKIIAVVTMIIDHIGFGFSDLARHIMHDEIAMPLYRIFRCIGRVSMPLFMFCISEGCRYTKDIKKYALRLFAFMIISYIPFSMFLSSVNPMKGHYPPLYDFGDNNVFFNLCAGVICIALYNLIREKLKNIGSIPATLIGIMPTIALSVISNLFNFDYGWEGTAFIFILYFLAELKTDMLTIRIAQCQAVILFVCISETMVLPQHFAGSPIQLQINSPLNLLGGLLATIPILLYNSKQGYNKPWSKQLFYWIYPLHIALFSMINYLFVNRFLLSSLKHN
jgi:hypothetical protein